jgi:hypothetical protein
VSGIRMSDTIRVRWEPAVHAGSGRVVDAK